LGFGLSMALLLAAIRTEHQLALGLAVGVWLVLAGYGLRLLWTGTHPSRVGRAVSHWLAMISIIDAAAVVSVVGWTGLSVALGMVGARWWQQRVAAT
jgi:hypothetical protein